MISYKLFIKAFELYRICTLEDKEVNLKKRKGLPSSLRLRAKLLGSNEMCIGKGLSQKFNGQIKCSSIARRDCFEKITFVFINNKKFVYLNIF